MARNRQPRSIRSLLVLAPAALAQGITTDTTPKSNPTTTRRTFQNSVVPYSSSFYPSARPTDSAPTGNQNKSPNTGGLYQYYFIFLALLVCCLGLAIFFGFRRRSRTRAARRGGNGRVSALHRDVNRPGGLYARQPRRQRRNQQGRWEEVGREEGLNEEGHAPPPYLPKRQSQEQQRSEEMSEGGPAIPMETLSRDEVGLKPPDYVDAPAYESETNARDSVASASSPRHPGRTTDS